MTKSTIKGMDPIRTVQLLRKGIGTVSIAMPFLLIILSLIPFFEVDGIQISLSAYYYTNIREIFTGILCIVGFFLLVYKSDYEDHKLENTENILVRIMGFSAIGVALIPTNCKPLHPNLDNCIGMPSFIPYADKNAAIAHVIVSALLFLTFAYTSYKIFPINKDSSIDEKNKTTYRFCSLMIVIAVILLFGNFIFNFYSHMTLVSEIIILLSFGYSWFTKGNAEKTVSS